MTTSQKHFAVFILGLLLIALGGSVALFIGTAPWGIGGDTDSAHYIGGARNILTGYGYTTYQDFEPITQWPPFFPLSLAVLGIFGLDPMDGARALQTILFGLNIFMVAVILKKFTQSTGIALAGAWFMLTSGSMLAIHSMAWSEPWFILLTFTSFFFLSRYLRTDSRPFLFYAAALMALACLDRYAGLALIAASVITLFSLHRRSFLIRLADCALFSFLVSFPLILWLLRNRLVAGDLTDRRLEFHLPSSKYFPQLLDTLSSSILPLRFSKNLEYPLLILILTVFMILAILVILKKARQHHEAKDSTVDEGFYFMISVTVFAVCNIVLELVHLIFMDIQTKADDRHFSVFFVAGLFITAILLGQFLKLYPHARYPKRIIILFFILLGFSYSLSATKKLTHIYQQGSAYTNRLWKTSPTLIKVKTLPANALIYSNDPSIIYLNTHKSALRLPPKYRRKHSPHKELLVPNERFGSKLERVKKKLIAQNGYVVLLNKPFQRHKVSVQDLEQHMSLVLIHHLSDGAIYQVKSLP